jgi:hypothetical protein
MRYGSAGHEYAGVPLCLLLKIQVRRGEVENAHRNGYRADLRRWATEVRCRPVGACNPLLTVYASGLMPRAVRLVVHP